MRAAIITRHAIANYGSLLQAFATEQILRDMGFDPVIIDYIRTDEKPENITKLLLNKSVKWNKNFFTRAIYYLVQQPDHVWMGRAFRKFQRAWLTLSDDTFSSIDELKKNTISADIYCTGSDQVWGDIGNSMYDPAYFLNFVPDSRKKISIAASLGYTVIPEEITQDYIALLNSYQAITVREKSAKELLSGITHAEVKQILDPTLLYEVQYWEEKLEKISFKNYVLIYQLNTNREMDRYAELFAEKTGKHLVRVSPELHNWFKSGKFVYLPSPGQFLALIKNADYLITDSFHGTAFAIAFNTQFIDFLPKKKSTRNQSILELTDLMDRIVTDCSDFSFDQRKIDFNRVNKIIKSERNKSLEIIKRLLK